MTDSKGAFTFDSKEEQHFHHRNPKLVPSQKNYYPITFRDSEGTSFRAKPDFIYKDQIYVEFKSCQLNNKPTKFKADYDYHKQVKAGFSKRKRSLQLLHQWHHSVIKQGIVARALQGHYLLVFKDNTKLTTQAKNKLEHEQVPWCYEKEMQEKLLQMATAPTTTIH